MNSLTIKLEMMTKVATGEYLMEPTEHLHHARPRKGSVDLKFYNKIIRKSMRAKWIVNK